MQPSEYEIQREVEALRDIRRRSTTPGALIIDPDLPNQSNNPSPTTGYWTGTTTPSLTDGDSSSGSHEDDSTSDRNPNNPADDPFHLFWVPASLHPEIAPAEFRAFLKEHARAPGSDGAATLERSNSVVSTSSALGRKKSMLSRQYRPSDHDDAEEEAPVPLRRNRSIYSNVGPQLTINDLQKLEQLAEEASESEDPTKLRNVLRRSLSLNMSPTALDQMDMADLGDEADAPIIVPPPGQILRRAARTKIRKPGLPGDGGGHRFGASRRGARPPSATLPPEQRNSSDMSSSDHGDTADSPTQRARTFSNESMKSDELLGLYGRESFSEEGSIFDAYAREDDGDKLAPIVVTSPPPASIALPLSPPSQPQPMPLEQTAPPLHHPQPQRLLSPPPSQDHQLPSRTPSPAEDGSPTSSIASGTPSRSPEPPSFLSTSPTPTYQQQQRKDKDKKGLFGKWGADKGGKKTGKDKERESRERAEKESGFFGSLFSSKKKQEEQNHTMGLGGTSGREAAQALLGQSKSSKSYAPPASPSNVGAANNYARYPIHVERAIYRLSHIKLANPRRPLYEQVLISNLMFWYLGVINKTQTPPATPAATATSSPANGTAVEKERLEKEQKEREERLKAEKEKERLDKEREMEQKKKEAPRRGSLTKANPSGAPSSGRRAEMPVRGPQYEMQHRVIEQEYGGFVGQSPPGQGNGMPQMGRAASAPAGPQHARPKLVQPQPLQPVADNFYYSAEPAPSSQQRVVSPKLPPGAMPPVSAEQHNWAPSARSPTSPPPQNPISPSGMNNNPRRSRSPPAPSNAMILSPNRYTPTQENQLHESSAGGRLPGRSLSATAVPSPPVNGKPRKNVSAHAVPAAANGRRPRTSDGPQAHRGGEEEDVPLAVWQQQRRR